MKHPFSTRALLVCFLFSIVFLTACGNGGKTLTSATGTIYECLVVMNSRPLSQENINTIAVTQTPTGSAYEEPVATTYDLVRLTLGADMPCLPQMEPYFKLTQVPVSAFDNYLKPTRNILFVDINPERYTQTKAKVSTNRWSKPQAYYHIQAPSDEAFVAYWLEHGDEVREWFVAQEMRRQVSFYRASTNKEARAALNRRMDADMYIPEDFMLIMDTVITIKQPIGQLNSEALNGDKVTIVWCCNNKGPMRRDLVVYSYPYTDANTFTPDFLNARRDEVLSRVISASVEGSYMGTEYKVFPPQMRFISGLSPVKGEFYAAEVRGLWKIYDGEAMGGPYVSHTRLDEVNHRVITAETFLFAGGQKKRNALRQAEAILYTLQLSYERNALGEVQVQK